MQQCVALQMNNFAKVFKISRSIKAVKLCQISNGLSNETAFDMEDNICNFVEYKRRSLYPHSQHIALFEFFSLGPPKDII